MGHSSLVNVGGNLQSDLPAYFATWSDEISSRADRVRLLIGSRHWLSDGSHKEFLLREFLVRHLPPTLLVSHGFIRALLSEDVSPEIDVLVVDPTCHAPLFNEGGLLVVAPSSAIATIEVKSTYRKQVLQDATLNVLRVRAVGLTGSARSSMWSGIVFASVEDYSNVRQVVDDLIAILTDPSNWQADSLKAIYPPSRCGLVPTAVCIVDRCFVLLDSGDVEGEIRIRGFDAKRASAALALAQLFGFVRATLTGDPSPKELDSMLERIDGLSTHTVQIKVPQ